MTKVSIGSDGSLATSGSQSASDDVKHTTTSDVTATAAPKRRLRSLDSFRGSTHNTFIAMIDVCLSVCLSVCIKMYVISLTDSDYIIADIR